MTHDEIIDGLHMASGIVQNRRTLLRGKAHGRDMSPTELCLDSSYTSAIDACAAATTEIQRLGAQLAEIEAQEPAAWQSRFKDGDEWAACSAKHAAMVKSAPSEWPGYEVRALYDRPAPERAQSPISRDGVNINPPPSYPKPPAPPPAPVVRRGHDAASAQTCRCGPDGCSDSTSCPKGGAA